MVQAHAAQSRRRFLAGLAASWAIAAAPAAAAEPYVAQRFTSDVRERDGWAWLDGEAGSQPPRFRLLYGNPGSGRMGGVLVPVDVALSPIDGPSDPAHPMLQGEAVIARASLARMIADRTTLFLRAERLRSQPAVAVNRLAVVVHVLDTGK
jgi:hypothetical protein